MSIVVVKQGRISLSIFGSGKDYDEGDLMKIQKNYMAKNILVCHIGLDEYNQHSIYKSAKEIWEAS